MPPMINGRPGSRRWRSNPWPTRNGRDGGSGECTGSSFPEFCFSTWRAAAAVSDRRGCSLRELEKAEAKGRESGGGIPVDLGAVGERKKTDDDEAMATEERWQSTLHLTANAESYDNA
ncbi:hypothetical protein BHE74_00032980 [Ensete ventricosum]|nr:hypothetical protein BHE74_00032980 [Ensete ventricosum]